LKKAHRVGGPSYRDAVDAVVHPLAIHPTELLRRTDHGTDVPVRARVANLESPSAHADHAEILDWLRGFESRPGRIFLVHGEPAASDACGASGWDCEIPEYREVRELTAVNAASAGRRMMSA
jgi:hypothetical protein